ncbi:hypothetical protein [Megavirus chiliensis]|uniref:Uncharacterized protein n=2 Tax=Megamimivirinae TaxID=3044648 RepID=A0A2L2DNQ1_MIMIV|nr:hypothetical protein MegaChil _gp0946 [Megavirus chiliensis]AEQ32420.1 hypothetical protein [Megavirus chiliensis]AVG47782.1 hypothetical protein [Acanthamoeba polyphaga mimivirus]
MKSTRRIARKTSVQYSSNYLSRRLSNTGINDPYLNRFIRTSYKEKKACQAELNKWIKAHIGLVNKYEKLANDYIKVSDLVSKSSAKINNILDAVVDDNVSNKSINNDKSNKSNESNKITVDDIITYGQGIITGAAISFVIFSRFG